MKRYKVTKELKEVIKNSKYSLNELSRLVKFDVKNIYYKNLSLSGKNLNKLKNFLNIYNVQFKEIKFNPIKNLGKYAHIQIVKVVSKGKGLAEFIGIMLGDGNIYKNSIRIAFDKRNKKHIQYVENLFERLFSVKLKKRILINTNQAYLYYYGKDLIGKLLNFGLKRGSKIKNNLGIPKWIKENKEFSKKCIKGLIDTDGCIYRCKRERRIYIKFTNCNIQLLKDFKEVAKNLGYSFAKANNKNVCLYRKKEVVRFINGIKPFKAINGAVV